MNSPKTRETAERDQGLERVHNCPTTRPLLLSGIVLKKRTPCVSLTGFVISGVTFIGAEAGPEVE
jgi:hypothetical protein